MYDTVRFSHLFRSRYWHLYSHDNVSCPRGAQKWIQKKTPQVVHEAETTPTGRIYCVIEFTPLHSVQVVRVFTPLRALLALHMWGTMGQDFSGSLSVMAGFAVVMRGVPTKFGWGLLTLETINGEAMDTCLPTLFFFGNRMFTRSSP